MQELNSFPNKKSLINSKKKLLKLTSSASKLLKITANWFEPLTRRNKNGKKKLKPSDSKTPEFRMKSNFKRKRTWKSWILQRMTSSSQPESSETSLKMSQIFSQKLSLSSKSSMIRFRRFTELSLRTWSKQSQRLERNLENQRQEEG